TINRIVMLLLPLYGIWPGRSMILIIRVFWVITIAFIEFCHYLYFSTHLNIQNFFNLVDCLCSFVAYAKVLIKLVAFWVNQRKLVETLTLIMDDWSDCAKSDIGMRVTMHKAKLSDRITNAILILHTMSIFVYCLGVIIADADVTDQTIELPFVNKLTLPFNINIQNTYRLILIAEFVHMIFSNWLLGIVNAILLTLSRAIEFATYNCPWYNLKSKDIRILLFIILRSQKELTLTAGKIMDLSLKSFTSVRFYR
ncbi:hypothetical protein EAG_12882, partial [Camponotus floridanus]